MNYLDLKEIGDLSIEFEKEAAKFYKEIIDDPNLPDIVMANVIGSNNFNLFIILGIAGLIYPITVQSSTAWKEIPISLIIAVLLLFLANNFFQNESSQLSRMDGALLLVAFVAFIFYVFKQLKSDPVEIDSYIPKSNLKIFFM